MNKKAEWVEKDRVVLEEIAEWMRSFAWVVDSGSGDGAIEMAKIKQLAPQGLKILVNYI